MTFINESSNWDDYRLFHAVASENGLVGAAVLTRTSAPTLSRRMRRLEDELGFLLFDRSRGGYDLTARGHDLLARITEMKAHAQGIESWRSQQDDRPVVRITAGYWTSQFLARNLRAFCPEKDRIRIEFQTGAQFLNLSRNETDIAIRNRIPEQPGLKRRRIGQVAFAIYGAKSYCDAHPSAHTLERYACCDWVVPTKTGGTGSSSFWIQQRIGKPARLTCDTPQMVLEAAVGSNGLCVLPRITGDSDPRLTRCSPPIGELEHTQWLVSHQHSSGVQPIRKVLRGLDRLFKVELDRFC